MKYTGKIAIPDLTKGMEMIPQAYIARNKAYAAGRKQQADALKAANDARSKALAQLGGIEQDIHPFYKPYVTEAWERFKSEEVPQILAMDPSLAPGMMKMKYESFVSSVDKYKVNQDMINKAQEYPGYIDPNTESYSTMQASLPADRRLNASMQEFQEKWNYQTKGLLQGAHNVYNRDGSFSVMGFDVDPTTGQPVSATEIDGRMGKHFNDESWFSPSTMRVAPRQYEEIAQDIAGSYSGRRNEYDWSAITANLSRHWQDPMDFATSNRESESYEWRMAAAERIMMDMRNPDSDRYNQIAAQMPPEVLVEMFDLDAKAQEDYPTLSTTIKQELKKEWNDVFEPMVKYFLPKGSGSGRPLETLYDEAAMPSELTDVLASQYWSNTEVLNFSANNDPQKQKPIGQLQMLGIQSLGSQGIQTIKGDFLKPDFARGAAFWLEKKFVKFNPLTGNFSKGANTPTDNTLVSLIDQMVRGNPYANIEVSGIGKIDDRNDILMVQPVGHVTPVAISLDQTKRTPSESAILSNVQQALLNANPPSSLVQLLGLVDPNPLGVRSSNQGRPGTGSRN